MLDRRKHNAVTAQTGFDTDCGRKMAPTNAWLADEVCRFVFGDEVATGTCFDLLDIDRRLKREVKLFERLGDPKASRSDPFIEPFVVARVQLIVNKCLEKFELTQLRVDGRLMVDFEKRGSMAEPEFA